MERRVILDLLPRRRVQLTADSLARVAEPAKGQMTFYDWFNESVARSATDGIYEGRFALMGAAVTDWVMDARQPPPCTGWWDYKIEGTDERGRLWFQAISYLHRMLGRRDGMWHNQHKNGSNTWGDPIGLHSVVGNTLRWRGLKEPAPAYPYPVNRERYCDDETN